MSSQTQNTNAELGPKYKRKRSSSPAETSKRQRFSDLFSDDEHRAQDKTVLEWLEVMALPIPLVGDLPRFASYNIVFTVVLVAQEANPLVPLTRGPKVLGSMLSNEDSLEVIKRCYRSKSFKEIRNHPDVRDVDKVIDRQTIFPKQSLDGQGATVKSWSRKYIGNTPNIFLQLLRQHVKEGQDRIPRPYSRSINIPQSSGTGKSRLLDELAKMILVIPVNLRPDEQDGFPAPDRNLRDCIRKAAVIDGSGSETLQERIDNAQVFIQILLAALFETTSDTLLNIDKILRGFLGDSCDLPSEIHGKFRLLMTYGQGYESQGAPRTAFYDRVIARTNQVHSLVCTSVSVIDHSSQLSKCATPSNETNQGEEKKTQEIGSSTKAKSKATANEQGELLKSPTRRVTVTDSEKDKEISLTNEAIILEKTIIAKSSRLLTHKERKLLGILSFDEAHSRGTEESIMFLAVRKALRVIVDRAFFTTFLTTTGKIKEFNRPASEESSLRLVDRSFKVFPPFTELGFDQLAPKVDLGPLRIRDVARILFMARFGRPLFATRLEEAQGSYTWIDILEFAACKLMGVPSLKHFRTFTRNQIIACMIIRLGIRFSRQRVATDLEMQQIESHLRMCIHIDENLESIVSDAPSEPLLAEAASYMMRRYSFDLPLELLRELQEPGLSKGPRGELSSVAILTLARDALFKAGKMYEDTSFLVTDFFKELLCEPHYTSVMESIPAVSSTLPTKPPKSYERKYPNDENDDLDGHMPPLEEGEPDMRTFKESFKKSRMHFNHFITIDDPKAITRDVVWLAMVRGHAIICAMNQDAIDLLIPFSYWNRALGRHDVSAIFIQVKNDKSYTGKPDDYLFHRMDPYRIKFFKQNETYKTPLIRMVFALASTTSTVVAVQQPLVPHHDTRESRKLSRFTTYDVWCAGTTNEVFRVIPKESNGVYAQLLQIERVYPEIYDAASTEGQAYNRRIMRPNTAHEPVHFAWAFTDLLKEEEEEGTEEASGSAGGEKDGKEAEEAEEAEKGEKGKRGEKEKKAKKAKKAKERKEGKEMREEAEEVEEAEEEKKAKKAKERKEGKERREEAEEVEEAEEEKKAKKAKERKEGKEEGKGKRKSREE